MKTKVGDPKGWVAIVIGAVAAAAMLTMMGVVLDAKGARAATPTRATIEATQFTVETGQTGEAFAVCPTGKRAVGGGVVQSGPANELAMLASGPLDATGVTAQTVTGDVARQWYAGVDNFTGAERTFRVFAICSGDSSAKIKATPFSVQSSQPSEAFAVCGVGKRAVGGGVVQSGSVRGPFVRASGPLDGTGVTLETRDGDVARQWYAAVSSTVIPQDFKVFAICE